MIKKQLVILICIFVLVGSVYPSESKVDKPNFLIILTDDHGYGDVSTYHQSDVRTPNIDRIGKEGMVFTTMRSNCTVCSPSRAAILTGRYPDRVGVPGVIRTKPEDSWGYFTREFPHWLMNFQKQGITRVSWANGIWDSNLPIFQMIVDLISFMGSLVT